MSDESSASASSDEEDKKSSKKSKKDEKDSCSPSDSDDSSDDDSSRSSSISESMPSKKPKKANAPMVVGKKVGKAAAKSSRKTVARPMITLDEVPSSTSDPQIFWDAEKWFKLAVGDKLKSYTVMSPQGDTTKADLLLKEAEPFQSEDSVKKLPLVKVAQQAKDVAAALESWKPRVASWKIDEGSDRIELLGEKTQLLADFSSFDQAMAKLQLYFETIEQLKTDKKTVQNEEKDRCRTLTESVYCSLRNQGLPAGIGKVAAYVVRLFFVFRFHRLSIALVIVDQGMFHG